MKRTIIRNTFAALSVAVVMSSAAVQAAEFDNRQLGHFAPANATAAKVQVLATGIGNSQVGHFALQIGSTDSGAVNASHDNTEYSHR